MTKVSCSECGKGYDYNEDDFCPGCGAYNHPGRRGDATRLDGITESNHKNSFLHQEIHAEGKERQGTVLEGARNKAASIGRHLEDISKKNAPMRGSSKGEKMQNLSAIWRVLFYIFLALVIVSSLLN